MKIHVQWIIVKDTLTQHEGLAFPAVGPPEMFSPALGS